MDASARRVKAARNRQRLPPRSPASRWSRRLAGLLATAAFLGIGVASALMIVPDSNGGASATAAALATPAKTHKPAATAKPKPKPKKPKGPTKAQRAQRAAAVAEVRRQGFTTLKLGDYDYKANLRVLIGRPVGDAAGGSYAFFFLKDRFLGKDSTTPSTKVTVAKAGRNTVTLAYETSAGRTKVRFKLVGEVLQPVDVLPPAGERFVPRTN
jgi:hypothetical protein